MVQYRVGKGPTIRVVTDLLDPEQYPARELAALYHDRWESELVNDECKNHLATVTHGALHTTFRSKSLNVWAAIPAEESGVGSQESAAAPGEMSVDRDRLLVVCGERTVLKLLTVQPEGKKRMAARDFIHGYHPKTGEQLGTEKHRDTETQG